MRLITSPSFLVKFALFCFSAGAGVGVGLEHLLVG